MAGIFRVVGVVGDTVVTGANVTATVIDKSGKILENMVEVGKNYSSALIDYSARFADEAKNYRESFDKAGNLKNLKINNKLDNLKEIQKRVARITGKNEEDVTKNDITDVLTTYDEIMDSVK